MSQAGRLEQLYKTYGDRAAFFIVYIREAHAIDEMDDRVARAYGGFPDRLYLVGRDGKVTFQGKPGPQGFRPAEMEAVLKAYLARDGATGNGEGSSN